jgi:hypothetical protein
MSRGLGEVQRNILLASIVQYHESVDDGLTFNTLMYWLHDPQSSETDEQATWRAIHTLASRGYITVTKSPDRFLQIHVVPEMCENLFAWNYPFTHRQSTILGSSVLDIFAPSDQRQIGQIKLNSDQYYLIDPLVNVPTPPRSYWDCGIFGDDESNIDHAKINGYVVYPAFASREEMWGKIKAAWLRYVAWGVIVLQGGRQYKVPWIHPSSNKTKQLLREVDDQ